MSNDIKTELYQEQEESWFVDHLEGTRTERIPKPEIAVFGSLEILYREAGTYEVLGELVEDPYTEEGEEKVDYRPLETSLKEAVETALKYGED